MNTNKLGLYTELPNKIAMPEADVQTVLAEAFRRINELSRRLRSIEERYEMGESRASSLQDSIIKNSEIDKERAEEMTARIGVIEDKLLAIGNELSRLSKLTEKGAKHSDIEELRSLIELYAPFKQK